ncbi:hypothetical protein ACQEUU_22445 [Nonomuraea sp. CA-218870]|uniref:hypothetical protein n=1 Tax=Nonomuraea sp. CA-218870 TaxID=3239998 RepID=UPI003D8DBEDD
MTSDPATSDLEKALTAEFARAGRHAPRAAPGFLERVETRHRPRRRVVAALAAAGVVVLSAGGAVAVDALSGIREPAANVTPGPAATRRPARDFPPLDKVWEKAVHTVPVKLPDGRPLEPELFLDERTLLARTLKGGRADRMDGLWAYDVTARTARRLVRVTWPRGTTVTSSFIAHGEGHLAWWTVHKRRGQVIVDIWAAPSSGGAQRRVTSFEGLPGWGGIDMVIAGGHAVWSPWGGKGVYRAPLSGGKPQPVPGAARFFLLAWPWAASAGPEPQRAARRVELLDLRTGARRQAAVPAGHSCSVTWCVGFETATRRDGTGRRNLPGWPMLRTPALDRFLVAYPRDGEQVVVNLKAIK